METEWHTRERSIKFIEQIEIQQIHSMQAKTMHSNPYYNKNETCFAKMGVKWCESNASVNSTVSELLDWRTIVKNENIFHIFRAFLDVLFRVILLSSVIFVSNTLPSLSIDIIKLPFIKSAKACKRFGFNVKAFSPNTLLQTRGEQNSSLFPSFSEYIRTDYRNDWLNFTSNMKSE